MFLRYDIILLFVLTGRFFYDIILYCCLCWLCVFTVWYCCLCWFGGYYGRILLTGCFYGMILLTVLTGLFLPYDIIVLTVCFYGMILLSVLTWCF